MWWVLGVVAVLLLVLVVRGFVRGSVRLYRHDLGGYMKRLILVHPLGSVRLHHILQGDADDSPHDHPFNLVSIILAGRYTEEVWRAAPAPVGRVLVRVHRPRRWVPRLIRATTLHRLALAAPVWTLCFTGRRVREWGMQTPHGWVGWREYTSSKPGFDAAAYQRVLNENYGVPR